MAKDEKRIPFLRPELPPRAAVIEDFGAVYDSARFTNGGAFATRLARDLASYLGVAHCVPVANGTTALMLLVEASARPGGGRKVLMPSFTFAATALAVEWAGYEPVFCDIDADTWQPSIDESDFRTEAPELVSALLCNTFGAPADVVRWRNLCDDHSIPLNVDSAAGLGATYLDGRKFGAAGVSEIFSLHATKAFATAEGGIIATGDAQLAEHLCRMTNFGLDADGHIHGKGLNAKLSEFHAAVACRALDSYNDVLAARRSIAEHYRTRLVPLGFEFQANADRSPFQFVPCSVPPDVDRDALIAALAVERIECRKYFSNPLHLEARYADCDRTGKLQATESLAARILSLPMANHLSEADVERITGAIARFVGRNPSGRG